MFLVRLDFNQIANSSQKIRALQDGGRISTRITEMIVDELKALSVRQPWAWAIIQGFKDVENRSWSTSYRGRLLVHAGQRLDPRGFQFLWELGLHRRIPEDLLQGQLVGTVELVDVFDGYPSDWAARGHWHILLTRPHEFLTPIPCRGAQRLFVPEVSVRALGQARRHAVSHRRRA